MFSDHETLYTLTQACAMLDLRWVPFCKVLNAGELPVIVNARNTFVPESALRAFLMLEILDPKWSVSRNRESTHKTKRSEQRAAAASRISATKWANENAASRGTSGAELGVDQGQVWINCDESQPARVHHRQRDYIASAGVKSSTSEHAICTENPSSLNP